MEAHPSHLLFHPVLEPVRCEDGSVYVKTSGPKHEDALARPGKTADVDDAIKSRLVEGCRPFASLLIALFGASHVARNHTESGSFGVGEVGEFQCRSLHL